MTTLIKTAKVTGRRQLHFNSLDDILADVERLAKAKEIHALGNWSPGQVLEHLALVMNKSIDGFTSQQPAVVRFLLRLLMKKRMLTKPMSAGFTLPANAEAEIGPPPTSFDEGLRNFRQAFKRLKTEPACQPHPAFGPLTADEWVQMHCRHSALHLSFLVPSD